MRAAYHDQLDTVYDELVDPHRSQYTWTFSRHGDITHVAIQEDLSDG